MCAAGTDVVGSIDCSSESRVLALLPEQSSVDEDERSVASVDMRFVVEAERTVVEVEQIVVEAERTAAGVEQLVVEVERTVAVVEVSVHVAHPPYQNHL